MDDSLTGSARTTADDGSRTLASAPQESRADVADADVREAMARLGLQAQPRDDAGGVWRAIDADGATYDLTALSIDSGERWELVRARTSALLVLEHENVVPLVGAMPVGDAADPAPRSLVLVWPGGQMLPEESSRAVRGDDDPASRPRSVLDALDVLVAACRAGVALRSCGLPVPGGVLVGELLARLREVGPGEDARSSLRLHPQPWCGMPDVPAPPSHDVTREVAATLAREIERAGLVVPGSMRTVLSDGSGLAAPAPGDLAARALDLRERLGESVVAEAPGQLTPRAQLTPGALPTSEHLDWRALVRGAGPLVAPAPQARRTAHLAPSGTRLGLTRRAETGAGPVGRARSRPPLVLRSASSPRGGEDGLPPRRSERPGSWPTPGARRDGGRLGRGRLDTPRRSSVLGSSTRRGRAWRLAAAVVLVVGVGSGGVRLALDASSRDGTDARKDVATTRGAVAAARDAGAAAGETPQAEGPADAARRATVERVEVLAGLAAVPEPSRKAAMDEVAARLATFVAAGPVRDADLALVGRVLRGEATLPSVRAQVREAEVVRSDARSADVLVTYQLEPGGEPLRHTLGLVHDAGTWKVASVTPVGSQ
ncbi:hypothetical protein ACTVCO_10085 [Sanguibacter sp. A247]|uniref:hypothetical protein n=1 Tax=unclassified Sanguibacter TaxID=2645534 RepID=UPI003FD6CCC0